MGRLKYFSYWSLVMGGDIVGTVFSSPLPLLSSPKRLLCCLSKDLVQGGSREKNTSW